MRVNKSFGWLAGALLVIGLLAGCGGSGDTKKAGAPATLVNVFTAFNSDTPILQEFTGSVVAERKVPVQARVTGYIVEKYVQGGQTVTAGQALYRIDPRQYQSMLAAVQAQTAQARANYENALQDLERYRSLVQQGAISEQQYTHQTALVDQYRAMVEANEAQTKIASDNVGDTIVRAPFDGTLGVDDLPIGNFVAAGQTPLVTISSMDPVQVKFDLAESDYLEMTRRQTGAGEWGKNLKLRLSDGSKYEYEGNITVVEQVMTGGSGRFTVKANFPNPQQILRPGMFVRVLSDTEVARNSILVPSKAVQPLLDQQVVTVVDAENKVSQRTVKTGAAHGKYIVVTDGLKAGDVVVVEGQSKVHNGQTVQPQMLSREHIERPETSEHSVQGQ